jgi:hypothetical protein
MRTNPVIKTPANTPELVTKEGVHIYAKDRTTALTFEKIVNKFPTIWNNQGVIDLPLEQQLKVPLVEGWHNAKLNSRLYSLSRKDHECLDKTFDPMHEQGRMKWCCRFNRARHASFLPVPRPCSSMCDATDASGLLPPLPPPLLPPRLLNCPKYD